jgi:hypothetical protein
VNPARILRKPGPPAAGPGITRFRLKFADLLVPAAFTLWALGVSRTDVRALGPYGLPAALPVAFYAGTALLVVSAAIELARYHPSTWRMSVHVVALVVMLYGTAPLVYSQGRYSWLYKTIGVVQYVNAHGALNGSIDIYQNWSGFFALAAWFGKVAGVSSALAYAKWSQLVIELASLPLLHLIYDALPLTNRQRWVALLLYAASNWIAQDYFSPQSLGILFSLGIMAIAVRWLSTALYPGGRPHAANRVKRNAPTMPFFMPRRPGFVCSALCLLYFILTFTHELSPYILAVQLGALALFRLLRPRWLPILLAAIAVGYLLPHFTYVNQTYGLLKGLGNFFDNVAPPAFSAGHVPVSQEIIQRCAEILSVCMWGLALVAGWLHQRSGFPIAALLLLAFSPVAVLALQAYGNEGILRVYLFSLPWTAALAAMVLAPADSLAGTRGTHHRGRPLPGATLVHGIARAARAIARTAGRWPGRAGARLPRGALRTPVVLGVVLALFFPSFFGDDTFNRMSGAEVATITSFERAADPGPVYAALDNGPFDDTSRYNLFPLEPVFGPYSLLGAQPATPDIATIIANVALKQTDGVRPAYVVVTPSMVAYNSAYMYTRPGSFATLRSSLARSPLWTLIADRSGTVIYELPPEVQPLVPKVRIPPSASQVSPTVP